VPLREASGTAERPAPRPSAPPITVPGWNCWRAERAERVAFLIDGAAYFNAATEAMRRARRSIWMVGWDVDGRTRLPWRRRARRRLPLHRVFDALVVRRRSLRIRILAWRRSLLFAFDREWFADRKWARWIRRRRRRAARVRFHSDGIHPMGGSRHQKYIVVDDVVAFSGGLDLTKQRWDTPNHRLADPRRRDFRGRPYPPFHDVQVVLQGMPATLLGAMFRNRWRYVTGETLPDEAAGARPPWPPHVEPWMEDARVAISRYAPGDHDTPPTRETERLYADAIAAAQRHVYIENQYLTHPGIAARLAARLREVHGPEVVIVVPRTYQGRVEGIVMGRHRARLVRLLRAADAYGRLAVCYPRLRGEGGGRPLKVHSKLMIVDDRFALIGSSNISNRSFSIDTECDVAIEADTPGTRAAIRRLRETLLAEHLAASPAEIAVVYARAPSLLAVMARLGHGERTLAAIADDAAGRLSILTRVLGRVVDPDRPPSWPRLGTRRSGILLLAAAAALAALRWHG
jgi:phosphatidylserine/phosphatidylglycerophosphate/cardiolipin synthase-like enzyme